MLKMILKEVETEKKWGLTNAPDHSGKATLQEWCYKRKGKYGDDPGKALPLALSIYQDDILEISLGERTAQQIYESLPRVLKETFWVGLSIKAEENIPLEKEVVVIGTRYELAT